MSNATYVSLVVLTLIGIDLYCFDLYVLYRSLMNNFMCSIFVQNVWADLLQSHLTYMSNFPELPSHVKTILSNLLINYS